MAHGPPGIDVDVKAGEGHIGAATLPVGFRLSAGARRLEIVVRVMPAWAPGIAVFAAGWNAFSLLFALLGAAGSSGVALRDLEPFAVGIPLAYVALRGVLNRSYLVVEHGVLGVRHRPIPWFAPAPIAARDVAQLWVEEDHSVEQNDVPLVQYVVKARTKQGRVLTLVRSLRTAEQGEHVEAEIERFLHIDDEPVGGEVRSAPRR